MHREQISSVPPARHNRKVVTVRKASAGLKGTIPSAEDRDTAAEVLKSVELKESERDDVLLPDSVETLIDEDYIFYAAGLLRDYDEEAALAIMKKSIKSI